VRRGAVIVAVAALLGVRCGGGASSTTTPATPTAGGDSSSKLVVLDSGNFDTLVLAATRPSLVEFLAPT
jgi:hypothetical protein